MNSVSDTQNAPLPLVRFVHANSYPAGTYRQFFAHLSSHFTIHALDLHGHDAHRPVSDGWPHLVTELIEQIERHDTAPVILIGHSLGGILSLMAAERRPDLVRAVVMIDSPVVAGWRSWLVHGMKRFGIGKRYSPAHFSEKRRTTWPDRAAAHAHFMAKPMFARWAPGVLDDYLEAGLSASGTMLHLRFAREIETAIYLSLPHHLGRFLRTGLRVPVGFVGGTDSVECRQAGLAATRRLCGAHFVQIPGGHLIPMESPAQTAEEVRKMIQRLLQETR